MISSSLFLIANTSLYAHYVFKTFDVDSTDPVINFEVSDFSI